MNKNYETDSTGQTNLLIDNVQTVINSRVVSNSTHAAAIVQWLADSSAGDDTAGFWTTHRHIITITMNNLKHIDWIRGDVIDFDNTSFVTDHSFQLDGGAWTNIQWLIIQKVMSTDGKLSFTLLELGTP